MLYDVDFPVPVPVVSDVKLGGGPVGVQLRVHHNIATSRLQSFCVARHSKPKPHQLCKNSSHNWGAANGTC
jgi:hypothetical protein